jgi:peptidoglycan/xylan/chitin deacetylase (PgdA/CDA1 family)
MILAYHRVNPWYDKDALTVSPGAFKRQMEYMLGKGFISDTLEKVFRDNRVFHERYRFCITFDDGFADNLWYALPLLETMGIRPLIFLTAGLIGTEKTLPRYGDPGRDRFLNWNEVVEMLGRGAEFGSHALTHSRLTDMNEEKLRNEIEDPKKIIEDRTGKRVDFFCYPYGDFNERIIGAVLKAGYAGAVVTPGKKDIELTRYTVHRTGIYGHNGLLIFRVKIWRGNKKIEKFY